VRRAPRALALLVALVPSLARVAGAGETRVPLQVLADAALADPLREINVLDWCGKEPRAEIYFSAPATVLALAQRGERADVVVAGGSDPLAPLLAAGLALPARRFATQDGVGYWIAPLRAARDPALAQAFVDAVLSPRGQRLLLRRGFSPCCAPARAR
jgi:ABC-type molybdate transport system substrate-binding protein